LFSSLSVFVSVPACSSRPSSRGCIAIIATPLFLTTKRSWVAFFLSYRSPPSGIFPTLPIASRPGIKDPVLRCLLFHLHLVTFLRRSVAFFPFPFDRVPLSPKHNFRTDRRLRRPRNGFDPCVKYFSSPPRRYIARFPPLSPVIALKPIHGSLES